MTSALVNFPFRVLSCFCGEHCWLLQWFLTDMKIPTCMKIKSPSLWQRPWLLLDWRYYELKIFSLHVWVQTRGEASYMILKYKGHKLNFAWCLDQMPKSCKDMWPESQDKSLLVLLSGVIFDLPYFGIVLLLLREFTSVIRANGIGSVEIYYLRLQSVFMANNLQLKWSGEE